MLLEIHPSHPEPRKIRRAVAALEAGEIIAYPTDTVYGLGCDLLNKAAIDKLYQLKGMPKNRPQKDKTLRTMISAWFGKKLDDASLDRVVGELVRRKVIAVTQGKVRYTLPS